MEKLYGGHIVAKYLKDIEGIDTVFSLSGDHITRIYDGFLEWHIRLIDVRHEQAAVMAAHSWSLYTGKPSCINVLVDSSAISIATMLLHQKLSFHESL